MKHTDVPKRQRNGILARLEKSIKKYGFDEVRLIHNKFFKDNLEKDKLAKEIKKKEEELMRLKNG